MDLLRKFILLALGVLALVSFGFTSTFPKDKLPPYITAIVDSGERPDFSLDGKRLLYVSHSGGDIYEVEIATKKSRLIHKALANEGCWRALYLSNGDYFLTCGPGRGEAAIMILDSGLTKPPVRLKTVVAEGPAISRHKLKFAYTTDLNKIYTADIVYNNGTPSLANQKLIFERANFKMKGAVVSGDLEPQNFRPPLETEMTFSGYGYQGGDAFLLDLATGVYTDITDNPCYHEPEGMFPDGQYTLVESNQHVCVGGTENIDLYRFSLTDPKKFDRLTHFNDVSGFKATNPVVSDDGKFMAFMEGHSGQATGVGYGIFTYDLQAAGFYTPPAVTQVHSFLYPTPGVARQSRFAKVGDFERKNVHVNGLGRQQISHP